MAQFAQDEDPSHDAHELEAEVTARIASTVDRNLRNRNLTDDLHAELKAECLHYALDARAQDPKIDVESYVENLIAERMLPRQQPEVAGSSRARTRSRSKRRSYSREDRSPSYSRRHRSRGRSTTGERSDSPRLRRRRRERSPSRSRSRSQSAQVERLLTAQGAQLMGALSSMQSSFMGAMDKLVTALTPVAAGESRLCCLVDVIL